MSVLDIWLKSFGSLMEGVMVDAVEGRSGRAVKGVVGLPFAIVGS